MTNERGLDIDVVPSNPRVYDLNQFMTSVISGDMLNLMAVISVPKNQVSIDIPKNRSSSKSNISLANHPVAIELEPCSVVLPDMPETTDADTVKKSNAQLDAVASIECFAGNGAVGRDDNYVTETLTKRKRKKHGVLHDMQEATDLGNEQKSNKQSDAVTSINCCASNDAAVERDDSYVTETRTKTKHKKHKKTHKIKTHLGEDQSAKQCNIKINNTELFSDSEDLGDAASRSFVPSSSSVNQRGGCDSDGDKVPNKKCKKAKKLLTGSDAEHCRNADNRDNCADDIVDELRGSIAMSSRPNNGTIVHEVFHTGHEKSVNSHLVDETIPEAITNTNNSLINESNEVNSDSPSSSSSDEEQDNDAATESTRSHSENKRLRKKRKRIRKKRQRKQNKKTKLASDKSTACTEVTESMVDRSTGANTSFENGDGKLTNSAALSYLKHIQLASRGKLLDTPRPPLFLARHSGYSGDQQQHRMFESDEDEQLVHGSGSDSEDKNVTDRSVPVRNTLIVDVIGRQQNGRILKELQHETVVESLLPSAVPLSDGNLSTVSAGCLNGVAHDSEHCRNEQQAQDGSVTFEANEMNANIIEGHVPSYSIEHNSDFVQNFPTDAKFQNYTRHWAANRATGNSTQDVKKLSHSDMDSSSSLQIHSAAPSMVCIQQRMLELSGGVESGSSDFSGAWKGGRNDGNHDHRAWKEKKNEKKTNSFANVQVFSRQRMKKIPSVSQSSDELNRSLRLLQSSTPITPTSKPEDRIVNGTAAVSTVDRGESGHSPHHYLPLQGVPRIGDYIAYKVLEMSDSYCPVVSEYKEAKVIGFDPTLNTVALECKQVVAPDAKSAAGKFDISIECENEILTNVQLNHDTQISLPWKSLLEPLLLS